MAGFADCMAGSETLERARRGDMRAHEALYRQYSRPVFTLALRILADRALAEEVLQDTSIEVIRHLGTFREDAAFPGWVKRIATNKCLACLRSAWHRKGQGFDAGDAAAGPDWEPPDASDPVQRIEDQERLARALERLPPTARAVVWLYDVEGYSHQEIAGLMGRTVSFSKSRLSRAHEQLRAALLADDEVSTCMPQPSSC